MTNMNLQFLVAGILASIGLLAHAFGGGMTCLQCGCEMDKWVEEIRRS